jgi:hypothetical protein
MASVIGKVIGSRGHETSRQGSKDSGITTTLQTFTHVLTCRMEWDVHARHWRVVITRAPVRVIHGEHPREVLWEGVMTE